MGTSWLCMGRDAVGRGCWRADDVVWLDNMFERSPEEVGFFLEDLVTI